jgi:hypothetical protein
VERWRGINEIVPILKLIRSSVKYGEVSVTLHGAKALSFILESLSLLKKNI